jgi:methenyltetrahydromethanopterin cyclohydrolase
MPGTPIRLNSSVSSLVQDAIFAGADPWRVLTRHVGDATKTVVDFGIEAPGGLEAGIVLARVCMADLATIRIRMDVAYPWPMVEVYTDHPILACLASQYAGWEIKGNDYFAMGSGPMRAVAAREPLFEELGYREKMIPELNEDCFGVLESSKLPPESVFLDIASKCGVEPNHLVLLVAPTRSIAGTVQIVARSVETAMHKLHELTFDLKRVVSGYGVAPLPPPAKNDLAAIGRTNDAILYGARVVLYCRGDDASLRDVGEKLPSSASADYGRPFSEILAAYDHDFYKVDPLLFSPAMATLVNLDTGNSFEFGRLNSEVLAKSFG